MDTIRRTCCFGSCFLALSFFSALPACGQPAAEETNAAVLYRRAVQLWQQPSDGARQEARAISISGWNAPYPEAEAYLAQNIACLQEMSKAAATRDCDFTFGKGTEFAEDADFNLFKLIELNKLLLLSARHAAARKNPDRAADACLVSLAFTRHLAQTKGDIYKIIVLKMDADAFRALRECLRSSGLTAGARASVRTRAKQYLDSHYSVADIIRESRDGFMEAVGQIVPGGEFSFGIKMFSSLGLEAPQEVASQKDFRSDLYKAYDHDEYFKKEVLRQAKLFSDQYFDALIESAAAVETDRGGSAMVELKALERRLAPRQDNVFVLSVKAWGTRLMGKRKAQEFLAAVLIRQVIFAGLQGNQLSRTLDKYEAWQEEAAKLEKALAPM